MHSQEEQYFRQAGQQAFGYEPSKYLTKRALPAEN